MVTSSNGFAPKGITVNKDTKITITQTQWEVGTANRWFLDNIKISEPIKL